jgi:hypothetical protein
VAGTYEHMRDKSNSALLVVTDGHEKGDSGLHAVRCVCKVNCGDIVATCSTLLTFDVCNAREVSLNCVK